MMLLQGSRRGSVAGDPRGGGSAVRASGGALRVAGCTPVHDGDRAGSSRESDLLELGHDGHGAVALRAGCGGTQAGTGPTESCLRRAAPREGQSVMSSALASDSSPIFSDCTRRDDDGRMACDQAADGL